MMEPALQLALHGTAYRTGAVTSARRVLMNYELGGCAGDWQGPQRAVKGRQTGLFRPNSALCDSKHSLQCLGGNQGSHGLGVVGSIIELKWG